MKKIQALLAGIGMLSMSLQSTAQESEPVLLSVIYEFSQVTDTSHREQPIKEEMILRLGQNSSRYTSYSIESHQQQSRATHGGSAIATKDETITARSFQMGRPPGGPPAALAVVFGPGVTQETLFQHTKENKLNKLAALGGTDYLIECTLPKIDWKVNKETRQIGGYTCQKAVGNYAGRTYTAWFAPELPFQNGPWKLNGLPGLILEASDARNEVSFLFKEINRDTANQITGTTINKLVTVSDKVFDPAQKAYLNDPKGVRRSQLPPGFDGEITIFFIDASGKYNTGETANTLFENYRKERQSPSYNPLELTKQ